MRSVTAAAADVEIDRGGVGIDVDEPRDGAGRAHRRGGRHRGERGHDHLVTGTDAERDQREAQGVGTGRDGDGVAAPDERRRTRASNASVSAPRR